MHTLVLVCRIRTARRAALRAAAAVLACAAGAWAAAQTGAAGFPLRNLLIEVRQSEDEEGSRREQGVSGSVVASGGAAGSSSSNVSGGASVHSGQTYATRRGDGVQQVLVLNGGRAAVRLGHTQALQWYQVAWNERDGATLLPSMLWLEAGRGIVVHPRWTVGASTVTVEISTESSRLQPAGGGSDVPVRESAGTSTTVQVPLGVWVTVARTGQHTQQRDQQVWSSRDASRDEHRVVQLRVSLR